jgi:hypothetical protein
MIPRELKAEEKAVNLEGKKLDKTKSGTG